VKYKHDIENVKEKFNYFWGNEYAGRALVSITAPKEPGMNISMFENSDTQMHQRPEDLKAYWENPETIFNNNIKRIENTCYVGEAIPIIFQNFGTSGHCNYIGAKPVYGNDTIWFNKVYENIEDIPKKRDEKTFNKHLELSKYLAKNSNDQYFLGMPDNTGTIDAIAHVFDSSKLLLEMYENPEGVIKAILKVNKIWKETSEEFYKISENINNGGAHAWMHLLAPGRLQHMQCDLSVMISPEMYENFVMPELEKQMEWIEYPVYHFDGIEQQRHLDCLLSLSKLKAIQWTEVAGQPSPSHFIPIIKKIQDAGKRLIVMCQKEDIIPLLQNLSATGLYLHVSANNPEEAKDILQLVENHSRR